MADGVGGTAGKSLDKKQIGMFLFYILIIAVCIGVLLYILFNARPSVEPKIKNSGIQSRELPLAKSDAQAYHVGLESDTHS